MWECKVTQTTLGIIASKQGFTEKGTWIRGDVHGTTAKAMMHPNAKDHSI
jgi:hypothetical protein